MRSGSLGLRWSTRLPTHARAFSRQSRFGFSPIRPGNHSEPLKGVEYWIKALEHPNEKPCPKLLVAARSDRAAPTLTELELENFCRRHGIQEGFVATSAFSGSGVEELLERMTQVIAWETMSSTVTTGTFKRIKEYVLSLKESGRDEVLLEPAALESKLRAIDIGWNFSTDEMMAAVQHLANHGYVSVLRGSSGRDVILLYPEVLSNLASSFVLEARRNPSGLGALEESRILRGEYNFQEVARLRTQDREVLLDAVTALFLQRNICFRERLGSATFLIFPSLINQKKPLSQQFAIVEDVRIPSPDAWRTSMRRSSCCSDTAILLREPTSGKTRLNTKWMLAKIRGFTQITDREGEIDLVHYYGPGAGEHVKLLFQGLFRTFSGCSPSFNHKVPSGGLPPLPLQARASRDRQKNKTAKDFPLLRGMQQQNRATDPND